jgi:hypothetical protein
MILNPNCSESVLRFYTIDPIQMQKILQAIKDEIIKKYPSNENAWLKPKTKIPLLAEAKMYDTGWNGELSYHGDVRKKFDKQINENWAKRDKHLITQQQALINNGKIVAKMNKEIYPNSMLKACAGLGDNEAVITVKEDSFILNIGNNDIQIEEKVDTTGPRYEKLKKKPTWVELVVSMGLKVQEAEYSEELTDLSRDCTCGVTFFDGYDKLIVDPDFAGLLHKVGLKFRTDLPYSLEDEDGEFIRDKDGKTIDNPERKDVAELLLLFKLWRVGKGIVRHLTTVEHARRFLKEPFTKEMFAAMEKNGARRLEDDLEGQSVTKSEKRRKELIKKYAKEKN